MSSLPELFPIPGFPGYHCSKDGRVWSTRYVTRTRGKPQGWDIHFDGEPRLLSQREAMHGYKITGIMRPNGPQYTVKVHVLMLWTFKGPCPEGMQCRHLDGNRHNNSADNLEWGTAKQNAEDRQRHGTQVQGTRSPRAKLTDDHIRTIRSLHRNGWRQVDIAEKFGIIQAHVSRIVRRTVWRHVQ